MTIFLCATTQALAACRIHLPPATPFVTVTQYPDYPNGAGCAVRTLAKQGNTVLVAPDVLAGALLALPENGAPGSHDRHTRYAGMLRSTGDLAQTLRAAEVRLLLLDGDVWATYDPEAGSLALNGNGCALVLTRLADPGGPPAALTLDVLTPGTVRRW